MKDMKRWEREDGVKFLGKIGIESGQTILDFGARNGHYTIPAARIAGQKGMVYALDKDKAALKELQEKATKKGLKNITLVETDGSPETGLENGSVDVVLAYDVLHLIDHRKELYKEIYRVLRQHGLFSVYPKHNKFDSPGWGLENMTPEDIKAEIEDYNFNFEGKYCGVISHDEGLNQGCVFNFRKE